MLKIENSERQIKFEFSSQLNNVEIVIQNTHNFISNFNFKDWGPIRLILRELLINAIEHGNAGIQQAMVRCEVENISPSRFKIRVEDEGYGFDYENIQFSLNDPTQERQRGLILVNQYSDEIEFENNGSVVTSYLTLSNKTIYEHTTSDKFQEITPNGNITANTAAELKSLLLELYESGNHYIRFDLKDVEDIDSVGLSVLIALYNSLSEEDDKELEMINVCNDCRELFRVIRLDTMFKIKN